MKDLINNILRSHISKGEKIDKVRKLIKEKYGIIIDDQSLTQRMKNLEMELK